MSDGLKYDSVEDFLADMAERNERLNPIEERISLEELKGRRARPSGPATAPPPSTTTLPEPTTPLAPATTSPPQPTTSLCDALLEWIESKVQI